MSKGINSVKTKTKSPSWQVIYMDLMTIIMVFFVIIWSLNQAKQEGISTTVGDVTSRMINLPGDVLFSPGKTTLSAEGRAILAKIFTDEKGGSVLDFTNASIAKRMIVFHGHTDGDGKKDQNIQLGFQRALSSYREVAKFSKGLQNNVIICTHADNSSEEDVPLFKGKLSNKQRLLLKNLKSKNRRITIEDKSVNKIEEESN